MQAQKTSSNDWLERYREKNSHVLQDTRAKSWTEWPQWADSEEDGHQQNRSRTATPNSLSW